MRVGIIQSNFLPWRGYFDFIKNVDLFIFHDDLQYTKGDWRNRNKIKTPQGTQWITVPVHYQFTNQLIDETTIIYQTDWPRHMLNCIKNSYAKAPYFEVYFPELTKLLIEPAQTISDLNVRLIHWVCSLLDIHTPMVFSRQYHPVGTKTERLIGILKQVGATTYLSGPAAKSYLIPELFINEGIKLEYKAYGYLEYPQLYPPYDPFVSVIDLIFMTGKKATSFLTCTKENS
jgi:hypothetical protein